MSDLTLRQLEYAVAVADERHFGRAARRMSVSQPGLSSQIRALEAKLGIELFERTTRGVQITPAGAEVVRRARLVASGVSELVASARLHDREMIGPVQVAAIPTMAPYLMPAVVSTLSAAWPTATLHLQELQTSVMVEAIESGSVDLGLLALPVDIGSLTSRPVGDEDFHLAVPVGHELATGGPVDVAVLGALPMLLLEEGHCLREHALAACSLADDVPHRDVKSAGLAMLTQMVAAGLGATLLPASAVPVEARAGSGVVARPFRGGVPGRTVAFVWRPTDPRASWFESVAADLSVVVADVLRSVPA